jgi:hypothetical protein
MLPLIGAIGSTSTHVWGPVLDYLGSTYRALQKYLHELHADRDHAKSNSQNRSIPGVQLTCDHTAS